jgi:hypothetical protein
MAQRYERQSLTAVTAREFQRRSVRIWDAISQRRTQQAPPLAELAEVLVADINDEVPTDETDWADEADCCEGESALRGAGKKPLTSMLAFDASFACDRGAVRK